MATQQAPPGWYTNPYGQLQWWDGYAWGPLAQQQLPPSVPAQVPTVGIQRPVSAPPLATPPAQAAGPAGSGSAASSTTLPNVSWFVWGALSLGVIALLIELIALLPILGIGWQLELDEYGNLPGGGMTQALPTVPLWLPAILAAGGVALAIVGLRKSAKKRTAVVALIVAGFAVVAPVIVPPLLIVVGFAIYAATGIGSQLGGGPTLG